MKPLPVALLTREDMAIWERVDTRRQVVGGDANLWADCEESDRRDADLMYAARVYRNRPFPQNVPPLELITAGETIDCGGALRAADPVWRHRHAT